MPKHNVRFFFAFMNDSGYFYGFESFCRAKTEKKRCLAM